MEACILDLCINKGDVGKREFPFLVCVEAWVHPTKWEKNRASKYSIQDGLESPRKGIGVQNFTIVTLGC
jgi:hypothetical protein